LLGAAIGLSRFNPDQPVSLERLDVAAERGAIHDHLSRQFIDGQGSQPLELGQNRKLCRAQPGRRKISVVVLADVPSRRPDGEEVAFLRSRQVLGHVERLLNNSAYTLKIGVYASMSSLKLRLKENLHGQA